MAGRTFFWAFSDGQQEFNIEGDEHHHLARVMRARAGEEILVVNGRGSRCRCRVESVGGRSLAVRVLERESSARPALRAWIAPSLTRSANTSWMMEKLCELGVDRISPLICEHTETERRMAPALPVDKWRKLAVGALKVNRRLWLTEIDPPQPLVAFLEALPAEGGRYALDCTEAAGRAGKWVFPATAMIGPPGGFSPAERRMLADVGFFSIRINEAVLRTETAAVSIAALLRHD